MNKRQKETIQFRLDDEKKVLAKLKRVYGEALRNVEARIAVLLARDDADLSHVIYQVEYQKALKAQISAIMDALNAEQFETVADYLARSYEDGYIGTMYDIQGQGIPIIAPINQELAARAITHDTKLSKSLYAKLGEDVAVLKKKIATDISRGIAQSLPYADIAKSIKKGTSLSMYQAMRISRTEAHRISNQATEDAQRKAKEKGAEVVKEWDATLDRRTRPHHRELDGQVRELDEEFVIPSSGARATRPGGFGIAKEDIHCRCEMLQRCRWEIDGEFEKMNNFSKQIESFDSPKSYAEFKKAFFSSENVRYMNYVATLEDRYNTKDFKKILAKMTDREYNHYSKLLAENPIYNKTGGQ